LPLSLHNGCGGKKMSFVNRLGEEKSPYLRQHKDNPVAWQAWGEEAFKLARDLKRPIFLSIGYSTCYWCHVMEKDSFEHDDVAAVINSLYVPIKIDREEHPEIDEIYMDAVVGMTGRGGWPMSVFLTPELKPFWGGTFFPRQQFIEILNKLSEIWQKTPDQVEANGQKLAEFLNQDRLTDQGMGANFGLIFSKAVTQLKERFDAQNGGFGTAPKFPPSTSLRFLLRLYTKIQDASLRHMILGSLDAMASGGIYDHLGGGFHRYSVDEKWLVPHFEKMLYDNALLATTYLEAFQVFGIPYYGEVARETLDYVLREMTAPEGGFFAAQDAGDVGREGEFYVWTWDELKKVFSPDEFKIFGEVFPLAKNGNFEHGNNILHLSHIELWNKRNELKALREKLLATRSQRTLPHRDNKVLTAWNGLMIAALAKGYCVLGDKKYLAAARASATFIKKDLYANGILLRRHCDGESKYQGTLADYSYLIAGLLELYQASFEVQWLEWAIDLQKSQDELFWDTKSAGYFTASKTETNLIVRKRDFADGALPSTNGVSAENQLRLFHYAFDDSFVQKFEHTKKLLSAEIERMPMAYLQILMAIDFSLADIKEIVVTGEGKEFEATIDILARAFLPYSVRGIVVPGQVSHALPLLAGKLGAHFAVYVCSKNTCQAPLKNIDQLIVALGLEEQD
jgi:uncharacterized protein YyaL (SSP411 family)